MRRAIITVAVAGACGSPRATTTTSELRPAESRPPRTAAVDAGGLARDAASAYTGEWAPFPECTEVERHTRLAELDALSRRRGDARAFADELRAMLQRPCLAHVAPALRRIDGADEAWPDLVSSLGEATHGFTVRDGKRFLVIPPEPTPALSAAATSELAPLACAAGDAACTRAASYMLRAENAFDAVAQTELAPLRARDPKRSGPGQSVLERGPVEIPLAWCFAPQTDYAPATFLEWVDCLAQVAPRTLRFARKDLRAPDSGWLLLRGRRGHYISQDEIRAYDLATGAAYIVSDGHESPPRIEAYTGVVAADQVRELAFVLLARKAIVAVRAEPMNAVVPDQLALGLGDFEPAHRGRMIWQSTAQTDLAFSFSDDKLERTGSFVWPNSRDEIDNHVVELVSVLEAGFVRGCAPAKLPPRARLFHAAAHVAGEEDPRGPMGAMYAELERRLDGLRTSACARAR